MDQLKIQAKRLGIKLSKVENGKRKSLTFAELQKKINKEKDRIVDDYLNRSKKLLSVCKVLIHHTKNLNVPNKKSKVLPSSPKKKIQAPPPPPPPPLLKRRPSPVKKKKENSLKGMNAVMNELRKKVKKINT